MPQQFPAQALGSCFCNGRWWKQKLIRNTVWLTQCSHSYPKIFPFICDDDGYSEVSKKNHKSEQTRSQEEKSHRTINHWRDLGASERGGRDKREGGAFEIKINGLARNNEKKHTFKSIFEIIDCWWYGLASCDKNTRISGRSLCCTLKWDEKWFEIRKRTTVCVKEFAMFWLSSFDRIQKTESSCPSLIPPDSSMSTYRHIRKVARQYVCWKITKRPN